MTFFRKKYDQQHEYAEYLRQEIYQKTQDENRALSALKAVCHEMARHTQDIKLTDPMYWLEKFK